MAWGGVVDVGDMGVKGPLTNERESNSTVNQ